MTEIHSCLPRPPSKRKCHDMSFQGNNRTTRVGFEPLPFPSRSPLIRPKSVQDASDEMSLNKHEGFG